MFDGLISGLMINLQLGPFCYMLIGCAIGFWVGILPGIGGAATLALMMPFVFKMTPAEALPFLLGMHSVVATTGDITSVLFGIPGEGTAVATIIDGYPMAQKGEAGRALGAVLMSSLIGAIVGAVFLAFTIPIVRPLVLALGSPEMFMVVILGLTCIATLSGRGKLGLVMGLLSGGFGLICSMVGMDLQIGILRFTFGQLYLWNGLKLLPVMIGFFAIPELIELTVKGTAIAGDVRFGKLDKGVMEGIKDNFIHIWLVIRCSLIASVIGIMPGLGGSVSQWLCYAHAKRSVRTEEERASFGKGNILGVLAPGAANNAKEGAQLIPTVAFGVPASTGMAILTAALLTLGLVPGPDMLTTHLALTYSMVWTIAIANIICVLVCLLFINHLAKLTTIRGSLINPVLFILCYIGAYASTTSMGDLVVMVIFGGIGWFMKQIGWPRPPFILGFILGEIAEAYLYSSTLAFGAAWLIRPKVILLFFIILFLAFYPYLLGRSRKKEAIDATS